MVSDHETGPVELRPGEVERSGGRRPTLDPPGPRAVLGTSPSPSPQPPFSTAVPRGEDMAPGRHGAVPKGSPWECTTGQLLPDQRKSHQKVLTTELVAEQRAGPHR